MHIRIALLWYQNFEVGVQCLQPPTFKVRYIENGLNTNDGTKSTNKAQMNGIILLSKFRGGTEYVSPPPHIENPITGKWIKHN